MWMSRVFSWLFAGVQILIPPVANEFIRRASFRHLASLVLIVSGFSCSAQIAAAPEDALEKNQQPSGAYPDTFVEDETPVPDDETWRCGFEWIVVEGPSGELIQSQIPLPCDPRADIYQGCPPPPMEEEEQLQTTKSGY